MKIPFLSRLFPSRASPKNSFAADTHKSVKSHYK